MKYTTALLGLAALALATNDHSDFHAKRNQVVAVTLASSSTAAAAPTQAPNTNTDKAGLEISAEAKANGKITFGSGADTSMPRSKGMAYLMTGLTAVLGAGALVV